MTYFGNPHRNIWILVLKIKYKWVVFNAVNISETIINARPILKLFCWARLNKQWMWRHPLRRCEHTCSLNYADKYDKRMSRKTNRKRTDPNVDHLDVISAVTTPKYNQKQRRLIVFECVWLISHMCINLPMFIMVQQSFGESKCTFNRDDPIKISHLDLI